MTELLHTGDVRSPIRVLLAHGAGAPMTSPFMDAVAEALANEGVGTSRFEFGYMASRHKDGKRRPPPKAEMLIGEFLAAVAEIEGRLVAGQRLVIGGKSMGGRVASMVAEGLFREGRIAGLVCLGYPFHPPAAKGRSGTSPVAGPRLSRVAHLTDLTCPALIVQGERDAFGGRDAVAAMTLPGAIAIHWSPDGDHDLCPRVRSGFTHGSNISAAARAIAGFGRGMG